MALSLILNMQRKYAAQLKNRCKQTTVPCGDEKSKSQQDRNNPFLVPYSKWIAVREFSPSNNIADIPTAEIIHPSHSNPSPVSYSSVVVPNKVEVREGLAISPCHFSD